MNKTSAGDGIPAELFQILKDDAVKVLHSICQQIWKTQPWPQDWKRSVFIQIPKKDKAKECSDQELPDVQAGFRKGRGTTDQIANICWKQRKQGDSRKVSTSVSLTTLKPLSVWITTNCGKFLKRREYQTPYLLPEKPVRRS